MDLYTGPNTRSGNGLGIRIVQFSPFSSLFIYIPYTSNMALGFICVEWLIDHSLGRIGSVAVRIAKVEVGEHNAHSFAVVAVETVSTHDVGRVSGWRAVIRRCNRTRFALIGADQV